MSPPYDILISEPTFELLLSYKEEVLSEMPVVADDAEMPEETKKAVKGKKKQGSSSVAVSKIGSILTEQINGFLNGRDADTSSAKSKDEITVEKFIDLLVATKKPKSFATHEIRGHGVDWSRTELRILGDLSVAMDVTIYDNGRWSVNEKGFAVHDDPFPATLIFTPGPLMVSRRMKGDPIDLEEIKSETEMRKDKRPEIDQGKYDVLIERRIWPALAYADYMSSKNGRGSKAIVVLPGLGCGVFAGKYRGQMGARLNAALKYVLRKHGARLNRVKCVYYDPFDECSNEDAKFGDVLYRVRLNKSPLGRPQLSAVADFEETPGEFDGCRLYKIVAWDHVSFPGNNFFLGRRSTDDGVAAAATNSMEIVTGVKGEYDKKGHYMPPKGYINWKHVVEDKGCRLIANNNVYIAPLNGGSLEKLSDFSSRA